MVPVLAGIVLIFFTVAYMVLYFGFVTKTVGLSCLLGLIDHSNQVRY